MKFNLRNKVTIHHFRVCYKMQSRIFLDVWLLHQQSQTEIVGTPPAKAVFCFLALLLVLPMLFIAVNSPNLADQQWEGGRQ